MTDAAFVYVTYIKTTPEKLWEALTSSDFTEKYFFGSKIQSDWQEGSNVTYSRNGQVTNHGIILKCEPHRLLSFTWNMVGDKTSRKQPSQVTFEGLNNGWPAILSNLKSLLETGNTLPPISI